MGAGDRQLECGVFYVPAGVGKGVGTPPPATGASGHMGQPNYETVQDGELIFLQFDRQEASLDSEF